MNKKLTVEEFKELFPIEKLIELTKAKDHNGKYIHNYDSLLPKKDEGFTTTKTELFSPEGKLLMVDDNLVESNPEIKIKIVIK